MEQNVALYTNTNDILSNKSPFGKNIAVIKNRGMVQVPAR